MRIDHQVRVRHGLELSTAPRGALAISLFRRAAHRGHRVSRL